MEIQVSLEKCAIPGNELPSLERKFIQVWEFDLPEVRNQDSSQRILFTS
jgi:hypothetical protein